MPRTTFVHVSKTFPATIVKCLTDQIIIIGITGSVSLIGDVVIGNFVVVYRIVLPIKDFKNLSQNLCFTDDSIKMNSKCTIIIIIIDNLLLRDLSSNDLVYKHTMNE